MSTSYPFSIMLSPESAGPLIRQFIMDEDGQPGDDWVDCLQEVFEPTVRDSIRQMIFNGDMATIQHEGDALLPFVDAWNALAASETWNDPEAERHLDTVMELLAQPPNGLTAQLMGRGEGMTERAAGELMIKHLEAGRFSVYEAALPSENDSTERVFSIDFDGWTPSAPRPLRWPSRERKDGIAHRTVEFPSGNLIVADRIDIDYFQDHLAKHGAENIDGLVMIEAAVSETQIVSGIGGSLFLACPNEEVGGSIRADGDGVKHVTEETESFFDLPGLHIPNAAKTLTVIDDASLIGILRHEDPTLSDFDAQALIHDFMNSDQKSVMAYVESGTFHVYSGHDPERLLTDQTVPGVVDPEVDLHLAISAVELDFEERPEMETAPEPSF